MRRSARSSPRHDASPVERIRLGDCDIALDLGTIQRDGAPAERLEPRAMAVLRCLLERPHELVSRAELLERAWEGRFVTDNVLSRSISLLRAALGDEAGAARYIATVPTRGYRLVVAPTTAAGEPPPRPPASRRPRPRRPRALLVAATAALVVTAVVTASSWRTAPAPRIVPVSVDLGNEAEPAMSPDGGSAAFVWSRRDGEVDLYVSRLDGTAPVRLTSGGGRESHPAWRRDGGALAFARSSRTGTVLHALSLPSGAESVLATVAASDVVDLDWSPDGRSLYYADRPHAAAPTRLRRLDLASGRAATLTPPPPGSYGDRDLALSPDGRRLAFARATLAGVEDLHVLELTSGEVRRLSHDGTSINGIAWIGDRELVLSSSRDGVSRLWRVAASGGRWRRIDAAGEGALDPSYAAVTRRLVFARGGFDADLRSLSLRPPFAARNAGFPSSSRWDASPAVAPDGAGLAFVSARGGGAELWIGRPGRDRGSRRLPLPHEVVGRPAWSPDGRSLAIAILRDGQTDVAVLDSVTGAPRFEIRSARLEICPNVLGADGSLLYGAEGEDGWSLWIRSPAGSRRRVIAGAMCGRPADDGESVLFVRPERTGIWRRAIAGGPVSRVPFTAEVLPWTDWDVRAGTLVIRPTSAPRATRIDLGATGHARSVALDLPPARFPGLGLSLSPDAGFVTYAQAATREIDILLVEPFE